MEAVGGIVVAHDWAAELNWTDGTVGKNPPVNAGDMASIPGLGRPHRWRGS